MFRTGHPVPHVCSFVKILTNVIFSVIIVTVCTNTLYLLFRILQLYLKDSVHKERGFN